jgi:hypothetical protein
MEDHMLVANIFAADDLITVVSGDVELRSGIAVNALRATRGTITTIRGAVTSASTEAWREELDARIAMRRRREAAGSSLEELEKKYGL